MALGNTSTRIIVAVIAIPLILVACILGGIPFLIFVLGISLISFWEFGQLASNKSAHPNIFLGMVSILLIVTNVYFKLMDFYVLAVIISVVLLVVELFRNRESAILNVGSTLLGIFYLGLFSSTIILIREFFSHTNMLYTEGGYLILSIMLVLGFAMFLLIR